MADRDQDLLDVYGKYVRLRESGASPDDAVVQLKPFTLQFGNSDLNKLGKLVQVWEVRQGGNYKPQPGGTPNQPTRRPGASQTDPDAGQSVLCPHCQRLNAKGELHCYACGALLQPAHSHSATKALDNADPETRAGTAYFGQNSVLRLAVRGVDKPLEGRIDQEAIIGRSAPDSPMHPDIDLAPFNAEDLGVSRLHASLKVQNNTLSLMDMDSKNHTFINGQRVHPHQVRVLHDSDEIRLGKLSVTITFKHQPRNIQ